jgi:enolase
MKERTIKQSRHLLHAGWVIANHILVSFHVAFISSVLCIPPALHGKAVLGFVFTSPDTVVSAVFWFLSFHVGIAVHEMGHYLKAVKLNALNERILDQAQQRMRGPFVSRVLWRLEMFLRIPYGKFTGVKRQGLTFYPDAPFNLAVAAAGPAASGTMASVMLPVAILLLAGGLLGDLPLMTYPGRLCLGIGLVGLLDFLLADPGQYREYRKREAKARSKAERVEVTSQGWLNRAKAVKEMMTKQRVQTLPLQDGDMVSAPWQFRNCGMGGRHTEKDYPESNISMQEMMFLPLCAKDYEEAQMITVTLQNRLKEVIEKSEGARVMGIGLEGGLAPYIRKEPGDLIPEQRMWRLAVQTIRDIGYRPGEDIAIAFDPALSELSNAFRREFGQPDAVGRYYFWRSEEKVVMSRDQLVELYKQAVEDHPIFSLEDAFAEDDYEGWRLLMKELGDGVFVIGDDLVTTRDSTIEECADRGLINTALIKANQIGTLSETMIAMLVALGKGLDLVVSHRSKSPNDDMEAQIALSVNALGLKAGGGANTERLLKYCSVTRMMKDIQNTVHAGRAGRDPRDNDGFLSRLVITDVIAYEEPTNAGIPSVGVDVYAGIPGSRKSRRILRSTGSTPLGTSAGTGEAIHLIDRRIERSPLVERYGELFEGQADRTYAFREGLGEGDILARNDKALQKLWQSAQRYEGRGCQNAVLNVLNTIAPLLKGRKLSEFQSLLTIDRMLLGLEKEAAIARGKLSRQASRDEVIDVVQRKGNLGVNAILSMSLALGRMIAHSQGKDLWQLLREEMKTAAAKVIAADGGLEVMRTILSSETLSKLKAAPRGHWEFLTELPFVDLVRGLRGVEQKLHRQNLGLTQALRKQMPVYEL